ncbi:hypothetical protein BH20BAC1_BH20BAC1_14660 [soil metagenome]|jgi:hypothetical protein
MRKEIGVLILGLSIFFHCCCGFIKEEHLGNNFMLSEYDNVDRRVLYSEERCSGSGIEIVPMTVTEYANDSKWIIAKSRTSRFGTEYLYWIVNKDFKMKLVQDNGSTLNAIKSHVYGPFDSTTFADKLHANKISLKLKKI